jgi:hypothetical protein
MELLKQGTRNLLTCGGCGSLLRYLPTDVRLVHSPVNVGHHEVECMPEAEDHYRAVVTCPSCTASLHVGLSRREKRELMLTTSADREQ